MKGQGSIEYLLMIAAILAIATVVVIVAWSLLAEPLQQSDINLDISSCRINHIKLNDYTSPYDGTTATAPSSISYFQAGIMDKGGLVNESVVVGETQCVLQKKYKLNFSGTPPLVAWLETSGGQWIEYKAPAGATSPPVCTPVSIDAADVDYWAGGTKITGLGYWKARTRPIFGEDYGKITFDIVSQTGTLDTAIFCAYKESGDDTPDTVNIIGGAGVYSPTIDGNLGYRCINIDDTTDLETLQGIVTNDSSVTFQWGSSNSTGTQWSDETTANKPYLKLCLFP